MQFQRVLSLLVVLSFLVTACAGTPEVPGQPFPGKTICDSYLLFSMCVSDVSGDETVDMIYFTDTKETFMYQSGMRDAVAEVLPLHRCAVPLSEDMQATTNRILNRKNLTLTEELDITRKLISAYVAAKPSIDECNAQFEDGESSSDSGEDEFSAFEDDWEIE